MIFFFFLCIERLANDIKMLIPSIKEVTIKAWGWNIAYEINVTIYSAVNVNTKYQYYTQCDREAPEYSRITTQGPTSGDIPYYFSKSELLIEQREKAKQELKNCNAIDNKRWDNVICSSLIWLISPLNPKLTWPYYS